MMLFVKLLPVTCVLFAITTGQQCGEDLKEFETDSIVPQIISKTPEQKMEVQFSDAIANCGNSITAFEGKTAPSLAFDADSKKLYTLLMIDPDAPKPENPVSAQFLHWLVVNTPGKKEGGHIAVDKGDVEAPYFPPSPPPTSNPHRYILLAYEQKGQIKVQPFKTRTKFNVMNFSEEHDLGNPMAGNFFYTSTAPQTKPV